MSTPEPWQIDTETLELVHHPNDYRIDLEKCTDSATVLDSVAQVAGKSWCSDADLGAFVRILNRTLRLQANVCGFGIDRHLDPHQLAALIRP